MKVTKIKDSRWSKEFTNDSDFGRTFSDHMFLQKFSNSKWETPEILPYGNLSLSPSLHSLHYGQSIFEGMKAFKSEQDEVFLFRPEKNAQRFNQSAIRMCMPQVKEELFLEAIQELLKLDHKWIPSELDTALYIRPFMFGSSELIKAAPSEEYTFAIITSPVKSYYKGELNLKIELDYTRASRGGTGAAKAAGNYGASFYPARLAKEKGFDQLIWTDSDQHKFIEEAGTMNIFFRRGNKLITPQLSDSILPGITRDSIIKLANHEGIDCIEERVDIEEIMQDGIQGKILEVFGVGTAVSLSKINSISYLNKKVEFQTTKNSFLEKLKTKLQDIQYGRCPDPFQWRNKIILDKF
jgi:branched-chain amino acid aminotransferase